MTKKTKQVKQTTVERKGKAKSTAIDKDAVVLSLFRANPTKKYSVKSMAMAMASNSKENRYEVARIISSLLHQGIIREFSPGKYTLSAQSYEKFEGTVDMASSGAAYVKVEGMEKDVLVNARNTGHALQGDIVKVIITRGARKGGNPEGEIIEIVSRSLRKYVGIVEMSDKYAFVKVDSRKVPNDIFVPLRDAMEAQNGQKVLVKVLDWPAGMKNPIGEIVDVFGTPGDNNVEMHAILAEFDLPYTYPEDVQKAADLIPEAIPEEEYKTRKDFRKITTFTIDPADAKDFDDALSIRKLPNGNFEVGVHIADVTHYVTPDTIIDAEGRDRATSVYLVDRTVPMLPERLSNFLCSLRPNEEKLCFSAVFELNEDAEIQNQWLGRTIILSDRRFTYGEAQDIIEGGEGDFKQEILSLNTLAQKLRSARFQHGSINFEREEAKFVLDSTGKPLSVFFKEQKESNQLIEEFMLLANRRVAEFVGKKRAPGDPERTFVYRIHEEPNPDKLGQFRSFIMRFGYNMRADNSRAVAREINKLMKEIHGKSEENIISTLAIRSMAKAFYSTDNVGHYGLAFDFYTHFTSPIRRYPDMMVHRLLARYLAGGKSADKAYYETQCQHSSDMEVRAAEAERASIKYKMVEFMLDKLGQEFDGTISGVTEWGIYVELNDTKIEGMVSLRDMTDDFYAFDQESYCVTGHRTGRSFTLGDNVRIKVERADLQRKQLDFSMVASIDFHTGEVTPLGAQLPQFPKQEERRQDAFHKFSKRGSKGRR